MPHPRPSWPRRMRRVVMWAAGVVLGVSVAAWVVSLWGVSWEPQDHQCGIIAWNGRVVVHNRGGPLIRGAEGDWHVRGFMWKVQWWDAPLGVAGEDIAGSGRWLVMMPPIWMLTVLSTATLGVVWRSGRRDRRVVAGHCPACNYDLTGIDGVCPECGGSR